jgi:SAM-dependent methyltransferase
LTKENEAWNVYWAQNQKKAGGGCLPCADASIDGALTLWWNDFARDLPRKARVIDMASGNGVVLIKLLKSRPDLRATGIDAATTLPPAGKNFKLRGGVSMEAMPFGDATIDVVTSQFGIEYANMNIVAAEMARILKIGGHYALIIHNAAGPIVAHNLPRLHGLQWAVDDQQLLIKARNWIGQKALLGSKIPVSFLEIQRSAADKFGKQSVAAEIAAAVWQSLSVGQNLPIAENIAMIDELDQMAGNEMGRINALQYAAKTKDDIDEFCRFLFDAGLPVTRQMPFSDFAPGANHFAWIVQGQRI